MGSKEDGYFRGRGVMVLRYHMSLGRILAVNYGIWLLVGLAVLSLALAIFMWRRYRGETMQFPMGPFFGVLSICLLGLATWFTVSGANVGWSFRDGSLTVKTGYGLAVYQADTVHATWIQPSGPYGLSIRTNGVSTGDFQAGQFRLHNGTSALVIRDGIHPWLLIIGPGQSAVVLSTPQVTALGAALHAASGAPVGLTHGVVLPHRSDVPFVIVLVLVAVFYGMQRMLADRFLPRLPTRLATHWGFDGKPDGWMSVKGATRFGLWGSLVAGALGMIVAFAGMVGVVISLVMQLILLVVMLVIYRMNLPRDPKDV